MVLFSVDPDPNQLTCARCGVEIGRLIEVEGEELVQVGGLVVRSISGSCARCGNGYYYSLSEKLLERLIKKAKNTNDDQPDSFGRGEETEHEMIYGFNRK